jgi:uncharacterized protein (DUF2237 family)
LNPTIALTAGREGKWAEEEDNELRDAVKRHGGKDWVAISALVPGRTLSQCNGRWRDALDPNIDRANARTGKKWLEDEDIKLKNAVRTHGGKNWAAITALVPGRTRNQCYKRWHDFLNSNIARTTAGRTGSWTAVEDIKLKDTVQTHGAKNWKEIVLLVPGRTRNQCRDRWQNALNPSIDRANRRTGKWTEDEDSKLKNAVQTHGDKDWVVIAALVLGKQCLRRWRDALDPSIDQATGFAGT